MKKIRAPERAEVAGVAAGCGKVTEQEHLVGVQRPAGGAVGRGMIEHIPPDGYLTDFGRPCVGGVDQFEAQSR